MFFNKGNQTKQNIELSGTLCKGEGKYVVFAKGWLAFSLPPGSVAEERDLTSKEQQGSVPGHKAMPGKSAGALLRVKPSTGQSKRDDMEEAVRSEMLLCQSPSVLEKIEHLLTHSFVRHLGILGILKWVGGGITEPKIAQDRMGR